MTINVKFTLPDPDQIFVSFHVNPAVDKGQKDGRKDKNRDKNSGGKEIRPGERRRIIISVIRRIRQVDGNDLFFVTEDFSGEVEVGQGGEGRNVDVFGLDDGREAGAPECLDGSDREGQRPCDRNQDPSFKAKSKVEYVLIFELSEQIISKL